MTLRVLVVHNRYRSESPSGENLVVDAQIEQLRNAGVEVETYLRDSDEIASFSKRQLVELAVSPIYSREAVENVNSIVERFRPDVVHVHNVYPLVSAAVIRRAKKRGCKIVQTVHNFRHVCPPGTFFRDGSTCTDCLGKSFPLPAVMHACYRDSRAQSLALATALAAHRKTWQMVDRFLPVSQFVADLLATAGFPVEKMEVVHNSVVDPGSPDRLGEGFVFAGRLSQEKGIRLLIDTWERSGLGNSTELTILGDGPERATVERAAARLPGLHYEGAVSAEKVGVHMRGARAVVVPSLWFEALPTVVLEAYSHGRPVVATDFGSLKTLVSPEVGWLASPDADGLAEALDRALHEPNIESLAASARERYLAHYTPAAGLDRLIAAYEGTLYIPATGTRAGTSYG